MEKDYPVIDVPETAENLRHLLNEKHISVRQVADYMGFEQPQAVYKWLSGKSLPTVDNLLALSRYLDISMESILIVNGHSDMEPEAGGSPTPTPFNYCLGRLYEIIASCGLTFREGCQRNQYA